MTLPSGAVSLDTPPNFRKDINATGVKIVHQIYGVFRDGLPMSELFQSSSDAWKRYCRREFCRYILWTADLLDTLIQRYASPAIIDLYYNARYLVQRVDIGRFFVLYMYGGLYADLDVFPNRVSFPEVDFGLCKMRSRTLRLPPEWEIEVVIAKRGNPIILRILQHMCEATRAKNQLKGYMDRKCRYIYQTTGPQSVRRFFRGLDLSETIVFFSMCRPIEGLHTQFVFDGSGLITGYEPQLFRFDVLSAFSMSYRSLPPVISQPLARPDAVLPLVDIVLTGRLRNKSSGFVELPPSTSGFLPGYCRPVAKEEPDCETEPEFEGNTAIMDAHGNLVALFCRREEKPACVSAAYELLPQATRDYIHFTL